MPRLCLRKRGPLLPKLRGQFAEFLQHRSLKRLGMLYQSTCVGFGYGLAAGAVSWNASGRRANPISLDDGRRSSLAAGRGLFTPFPSATASRPHLRAGSPPARISLAQEPWTCGERVSHPLCRYSCQHSRFRCLQQGSRLAFTGLLGTLRYHPDVRGQEPGAGNQDGIIRRFPAGSPAKPHAARSTCARSVDTRQAPPEPRRLIDVTEIATVAQPDAHFVGRADRHL